jgi:hypothetical protein
LRQPVAVRFNLVVKVNDGFLSKNTHFKSNGQNCFASLPQA